MSKNDKSPRERAKQIISDYESGSGRFSGMGKPTFPSTNKPTYPATFEPTYKSTYGTNKPTGAEAARSKMLEKQQDPERDLKNMNKYQAGLVRKRRAGEVPD